MSVTSPVTLRFPAGINNRARETNLPEGSLRSAENIDITNEGNLLCRKGLRLVASGAFHSLHRTPNFLLLVKNGVLSRMDSSGTITPLVTLAVNSTVRYAQFNSDIYWSTLYEQGLITSAGNTGYFGINTPPKIAATAVSNTGGLFAGDYLVTQTAVSPDGLESGAPEPVIVSVETGGGISVTVPVGATFNVYVTPANGSSKELRFAVQLPSGGSAAIGVGDRGKLLESLFATKPYPGQILRLHKGRLWIARGATIWVTSSNSPHWLFPATGYFQIEENITLLESVEDGLYVGTNDKTWFLQGNNPEEMNMRQVSLVGAVNGTGLGEFPYDVFAGQDAQVKQCAWLDSDGYICLGKAGGIILRPTKSNYCAGNILNGILGFRQYNGLRQFVVALDNSGKSSELIADDAPVGTINEYGTSLV